MRDRRGSGRKGIRWLTLLLEVVAALETAAEAIDGLAGLTDPESDGVDCFSQGPHLLAGTLMFVTSD